MCYDSKFSTVLKNCKLGKKTLVRHDNIFFVWMYGDTMMKFALLIAKNCFLNFIFGDLAAIFRIFVGYVTI
jgi:hypothetical protein